ncbi:MAG: hypothetical protein ACO3JL_14910 [Myxococcota bacterium]
MGTEVPTAVPPVALQALLHDEEVIPFHAQPVRRAGGRGVWLIATLGLVFLTASVPATREVLHLLRSAPPGGPIGAWLLVPLALVFLGFSVMLSLWPALSSRDVQRTHVVITQRRVMEVKFPLLGGRGKPRVRTWPVRECRDLGVTRRRGDSATLVLQESLRERRSDNQTVYEWQAIHGLPRADEALALLRRLRVDPPR